MTFYKDNKLLVLVQKILPCKGQKRLNFNKLFHLLSFQQKFRLNMKYFAFILVLISHTIGQRARPFKMAAPTSYRRVLVYFQKTAEKIPVEVSFTQVNKVGSN